MIRIIAKHTWRHAQRAAAAAGVEGLTFNFDSELVKSWLVLDAPDTPQNRLAVQRWFTDCPHGPPFPAGSCLWYHWSDNEFTGGSPSARDSEVNNE